jgi:hypothetical protein
LRLGVVAMIAGAGRELAVCDAVYVMLRPELDRRVRLRAIGRSRSLAMIVSLSRPERVVVKLMMVHWGVKYTQLQTRFGLGE